MATATKRKYTVHLPEPHTKQLAIKNSAAKRKIVRAGRRGGKTVIAAIMSVEKYLAGHRVLYAAPTAEQIDAYWREVKNALNEMIDGGVFYKNETLHIIERYGTENRIRAKTAWNADTLRGDYADFLILDEWQLMDEDAWGEVGAPMLLDNNGDAMFIYTPPSLHSKSVTKARDPRHAAKMFKVASLDTSGRWEAFHFTSADNPYISEEALHEITGDMSSLSYRQEILAEDIDEVPGALWTRKLIAETRVLSYPDLARVVVGVDPPGGATECGIVIAGIGRNGQGYIIGDRSLKASPDTWASVVLDSYNTHMADRVVGEANYGGDMVENTIRQAAVARRQQVSYKSVHASRGKAVRAEPVVAMFEQGRVHIVGELPTLEEELCTWIPGIRESPNRLDALVWAITELMLQEEVREHKIIFDSMKQMGVNMDLV